MNVAHQAALLQQVLGKEADELARETGFIQRERVLSGADFAQTLIFGWLQRPDERVEGFVQILGRREVTITASGLCQRFTPEAATASRSGYWSGWPRGRWKRSVSRFPRLCRFSAVVVEDSSSILLPAPLAEVWRGCGGSQETGAAMVKLFVRWDVKSGNLEGPRLTEGRHSDNRSPLSEDALPVGGLYLADLGFFSQHRLCRLAQRRGGGKRYFVMRLQCKTRLSTRSGHQIDLRGILPWGVGHAIERGVLLGKQARLPVRLLLVRLSEEVAEQRRKRLREAAQDHGHEANPELLYLAGWTMVVTNVPRARLSIAEALVLLRLRWQIERLFRLWKEQGQIDEWRTKNPWRILCELYAKLAAMLIQQWLIQAGCWHDPWRSLVKAAAVVRREANRLMVALYAGGLPQVLASIVRCMQSGCRLERRATHPSTAQLLLEGLEWELILT